MIEKVFDCDVDYDKFTIDGIKYPVKEFISRVLSLENMDFNDYDYKKDDLYDPKKKPFYKTIITVYEKGKTETHVD